MFTISSQPIPQPLYTAGIAPQPINMQPHTVLQSPVVLQQTAFFQSPMGGNPNPAAGNPIATPQQSTEIDDVPQPVPPNGWALIASSNTVDQTFTTLQYTYEYIFAPTNLAPTTNLPTKIKPPSKPQGWVAEKSTLSIDKDPTQHTYVYVLTYYAPE